MARPKAVTTIAHGERQDKTMPVVLQSAMKPSMTASPVTEPRYKLESTPTKVQDDGDFKPFQLLMESELTIEFGKKLTSKRIIHEELLCCYSKMQQELFEKAKKLRSTHETAERYRKQLKRFVSPRTAPQVFEDKHMENEAILCIVQIYDKYPVAESRKAIRELVDSAIEDQVTKRYVVNKLALGKKDLKGMAFPAQLRGLLPRAVLAVVQELTDEMRKMKLEELEAAKTSPLKAAIQHRIILPNAEEDAIRSLIMWLYSQGTIHYDNARHLYNIQTLAGSLGITQLAEQSLSKLVNDAEETIKSALHYGLTLQQLLGVGQVNVPTPQPSFAEGNVVQEIFHRVLKDEQAPDRLKALVVNSLAEHLDCGLWAQLEPMISHATSLRIIDAMLRRAQMKKEEVSLKLENAALVADLATIETLRN